MNYIDEKLLKALNHGKTIGIIVCREDNKYVIKYCGNPKIYRTTYEVV